jgi:hypothetical protein
MNELIFWRRLEIGRFRRKRSVLTGELFLLLRVLLKEIGFNLMRRLDILGGSINYLRVRESLPRPCFFVLVCLTIVNLRSFWGMVVCTTILVTLIGLFVKVLYLKQYSSIYHYIGEQKKKKDKAMNERQRQKGKNGILRDK